MDAVLPGAAARAAGLDAPCRGLAIALVGLLVRMGWRGAPQWGSVVLYLMRGWFCAAAWEPLARTPPGADSGIACSPTPWWRRGGSPCHFVLMLAFVAPMR